MEEVTRQEHLRWARERAYEYLQLGKWRDAFDSFSSDLSKHPKTRDHPALMLGLSLLLNGKLSSVEEMRKFIDGFN